MVYLSKSNACDPWDAIAVDEALRKRECEIVSYRGGTYTSHLMLASDMLILIAPKNSIRGDHFIEVGRGQYNQVNQFRLNAIGKGKMPEMYLAIRKESNQYGMTLQSIVCENMLVSSSRHNYSDAWGQVSLSISGELSLGAILPPRLTKQYMQKTVLDDVKLSALTAAELGTVTDMDDNEVPGISIKPMLACYAMI